MDLHNSVNHFYDGWDYVIHLDAVEEVHQRFAHELDVPLDDEIISKACYGHDLEEDTRQTYNDIVKLFGVEVAEIIHALTNEKGRNREERANATYYLNIRKTPGASFVKMCDRIANVEYSKSIGSRMFKVYEKENEKFMKSVDADRFPEMKKHLINLFKN